MSVLKKGIISIGNFEIGANTTIDDFITCQDFDCHCDSDSDHNTAVAYCNETSIDNQIFRCKFVLYNGKVESITLLPVNLSMPDPGYPEETYQAEKRAVCDAWLAKELGNPDYHDDSVTIYEFDWGRICAISYLGGRNEFTGGFIEITYKKEEKSNEDKGIQD